MDCRLEDCVRCTCIDSHALDVYFHVWRWDIFTPGEDGSYDTSLRFKITGINRKKAQSVLTTWGEAIEVPE